MTRRQKTALPFVQIEIESNGDEPIADLIARAFSQAAFGQRSGVDVDVEEQRPGGRTHVIVRHEKTETPEEETMTTSEHPAASSPATPVVEKGPRKFVQCSYEGYCINAFRRCEEEAGHSGPHGCTYKGEEWVTF